MGSWRRRTGQLERMPARLSKRCRIGSLRISSYWRAGGCPTVEVGQVGLFPQLRVLPGFVTQDRGAKLASGTAGQV